MALEPIENLIDSYEAYVSVALVEGEGLEDEARLTLITRNVIEDRWAELEPAQRERVEEIDRLLAEKHALVAGVLPNPRIKDRRRWWWFLHEGPQVRDKAQEAA